MDLGWYLQINIVGFFLFDVYSERTAICFPTCVDICQLNFIYLTICNYGCGYRSILESENVRGKLQMWEQSICFDHVQK